MSHRNVSLCSALLTVLIVAVACPAPAGAQQAAAFTNPFDDSSDLSTWQGYGWPFEWAVDNTPIEGHSAPGSLNFNNGTDVESYDAYFYGSIYTDSSNFNLTGLTDPVLSFWCRWDLPTGIDYTDRYLSMYNANYGDPYYQYIFGSDLNCGAANEWHQHEITINPALLSGAFNLEFYIYYDWYWSGGSGSGYEGWFIDDLQILVPDVTPPDTIADLSASNPAETTVDVSWTSPFDDDISGVCDSFDLRYSTSQITDANFASATQVPGEPNPDVEGSSHQVTVTGLLPDTNYFFAVVTVDKAGNTSSVSGLATAKTLAPPPPPEAPTIAGLAIFEDAEEDVLPCSAGTSAAPAGLMALAGLLAIAFGLRRK